MDLIMTIICVGFVGFWVVAWFSYKKSEREELQEKEEQEKIRQEEEKKLYEEKIIPCIKNVLFVYENQLTEIIKEYKNLIESNEKLEEMLSDIQEYIKETYTAISLIDIEKLNEIKVKIFKYKYFINVFEDLCMQVKYANNLRDLNNEFKEKVNFLKENEETMNIEELKTDIEDTKKKSFNIRNCTNEYLKQAEEFKIKTRKDIVVNISNFSYENYYRLYADLNISNYSLSYIKQIKIIVKIYQGETVVGSAFSQQILMLKPGEEFNNRIMFSPGTKQGNKFVIENYLLEY